MQIKPTTTLILALLLGLSPTVLTAKPSTITTKEVASLLKNNTLNDWQVDYEEPFCQGKYLAPSFDEVTDPSESSITADHTTLVPDGTSIVSGNVVFLQPQRRILADRAELYRNAASGEITKAKISGYMLLEAPEYRLYGKSADLSLTSQEATLRDALFRIYTHHVRGSAGTIHQQGKELTELTNASYTTCAPSQNTWMVRADHLVLNHIKGRGYATGASVRVKNIPIFYSPVFPFPVGKKRHSGFLAPHYAHTSSSGREIIAPYYFNIAPNQDLTLSVHALEERGGQLESNWRYLGKASHGSFYLSGLPYDRKFAHYRRVHSIPTPLTPAHDPRVSALESASPTRFAGSFDHYATLTDHLSGSATFNYVSDDNYLVDELSHHHMSKQERQLKRGASLTYRSSHWIAKSVVEGYQTLQPFDTPVIAEPYQLLPQLFVHGDYFYGYNRPHMELMGQATYFHHEGDPVTNASLTTGSRLHIKPRFSMPWYKPWGFLTPSLALAMTQYHLNLNTLDKSVGKPHHPSRTLPIATLDSGLFFDRYFTFNHQSYTQTLEPRAFYIYIPYIDQNDLPNFDSSRNTFTIHQLFSVNRFNSIDRIGDANQLSLALTSRIKTNATGEERLWLQIAQRFHFRERQVTLCDTEVDPSCRFTEDLLDPKGNRPVSPIIAELGLHLPKHWRARFETQWDVRTHHLEKYAFGVQYWANSDHIFNLAYYAQDDTQPLSDNTGDDVSQLDTSLIWKLNPKWRILGRWVHNMKRQFAFNLLGGIEYNTCCIAMRFGAMRSVKLGDAMGRQYANTLSFQVILKGLTGVGVDPSIEFKRNIPGYESNF